MCRILKLFIFAGDTVEVHLNRLAPEVNTILKLKYTKRRTYYRFVHKATHTETEIHKVPYFIVVHFFPVEGR